MRLDAGARLLEFEQRVGVDRVEVADDDVDLQPEGEGVFGPPVGGNDEVGGGQTLDPVGRGSAGNHEGVSHAHGPGATRTVQRPAPVLSRRSSP